MSEKAAEPAPEAGSEAATDSGSESATEHGRHAPRRGWTTRSHVLVAVLGALLGFAIVVQVRQTHAEEFSLLRQDELVGLLDEITQRNDQLEAEQAQLILDRNDLLAGVDASEVAERNATVQAILAGTIPVQGPGIEVLVREVDGPVPASSWVNLVEELRNAGAEAIEIGGVRFGASSWISDTSRGVVVDGVLITSPITVLAIGDPQTMEVALGIRGGALAVLRSHDATTVVTREELVQIDSVRELVAPQIAVPAPDASPTSG